MAELDAQRLNAFILARGLLERGEVSVDDTAPGAMSAVVLYDLAVETAAKATLAAKPPLSYPGTGYLSRQSDRNVRADRRSLPAVLDGNLAAWREMKKRTDEVPELSGAAQLHNLRNAVQHDGVVPSRDDLERSRLRALDAVRWLVQVFFETDLAEVSRAALVRWPAVREAILKAEESAASEDFTWGMAHLWVALEAARDELKKGQPYRRRIWRMNVRSAVDRVAGVQHGAHSSPGRELTRLIEGLFERVELLDDRMEALALGAEASEYEWFVRVSPKPHRPLNRPDPVLIVSEDEPARTREQYMRAFDFVTSAVLRWQRFFPPEADAETRDT